MVDFLDLITLIKVSKCSRGFYWICGRQSVLRKFRIKETDLDLNKSEEQEEITEFEEISQNRLKVQIT
jgi:hypothetical protein